MASKRTLKLIDTKNMLISWSLKMSDFFKHTIFMQKKEILIIGNDSSPFALRLREQLSQKSKVTVISDHNGSPVDNNVTESLSLRHYNYKQIQQKLSGKRFNAIVVIPPESLQKIEFDNEDIAKEFTQKLFSQTMKNVLAYRLAYKYLTKTGVIILSCSQKELVNHKLTKKNNDQDVPEVVTPKEYPQSILRDLISSQITHLGVVIGDRDYTNYHSFSVIAGSQEFSQKNMELTVDYYKKWINNKNLPAAGSFAIFREKSQKTKREFVDYI